MFGPYLKQNKVKCFVVHPVIKLPMVPYKMSTGHASVARENPECYLRLCC